MSSSFVSSRAAPASSSYIRDIEKDQIVLVQVRDPLGELVCPVVQSARRPNCRGTIAPILDKGALSAAGLLIIYNESWEAE